MHIFLCVFPALMVVWKNSFANSCLAGGYSIVAASPAVLGATEQQRQNMIGPLWASLSFLFEYN